MKRRIVSLFLLCLTSGFLACSDSDLPDSFILDQFRVLALLADKPEVNPGETVVITPFLSDIEGAGRTILFSAEACVDPGVGFGAEPTCEGNPTQTILATDAPVTGLSGPEYTGAVTSTVTVITPTEDVIFALASEIDRFNGVNYLVNFVFSFPDGTQARAFRRIKVSTRTAKNQNPSYDPPPLQSMGAPLTTTPTGDISLAPNITATSEETYDEIRDDGVQETKTESIETFWYISDGDLSLTLTDDEDPTIYTPPDTPPTGHGLIFVIVTRDGRGGSVAHVESH